MAYTPATPYPKGRGDAIRSADWNEAVNELLRLENEKFNRAGGTVTGNLTVNGTISGTLANNIVGPNQLAANAVTNTRIADNAVTNTKLGPDSVTADKIADGAIQPEHLPNNKLSVAKLEGFLMADMTLTISAAATHGFQISSEPITAGSRGYEIFVFAYSPTSGCYFSYEPRVYTSGTNLNRWMHITNHNAIVTEIRMKIYGVLAPV